MHIVLYTLFVHDVLRVLPSRVNNCTYIIHTTNYFEHCFNDIPKDHLKSNVHSSTVKIRFIKILQKIVPIDFYEELKIQQQHNTTLMILFKSYDIKY